MTTVEHAPETRPLPGTNAEEVDYAEFLLVRQQLADLRSLPEGVTALRSRSEQQELAEIYNAFEHYTAMADLMFEELQRRLSSPITFDDPPETGETDEASACAKVVAFRPLKR
jgi:hypothetical protein